MANKNNNTKMSVEEAGRKGGEARAKKYDHEQLSAQSKQAAKTIEEKHPGFHSEIGKKGGEARGKQRHDDVE